MHKLDRAGVNTPACLVSPPPDRRYGDLKGTEKEEIRAALLAIQNNRCAYCERRTGADKDDGHIEHFRQQCNRRELDLDWPNLFWSCNDEKTCGKHKDRCSLPQGITQRSFNPDDLINPCHDDPEEFMEFVSDGTIKPRPNLSPEQYHRYAETIRVFQLASSPFLRKSREDATKPYVAALDTLRQAGPELFRLYITSELARIDSAPFSTAVRHFLLSNMP